MCKGSKGFLGILQGFEKVSQACSRFAMEQIMGLKDLNSSYHHRDDRHMDVFHVVHAMSLL